MELLVQFLAFIGEYIFTNAHAHDLKQKQQREVLYKKGVLKNFVKFTGKHMRWSGLKKTPAQVNCNQNKSNLIHNDGEQGHF